MRVQIRLSRRQFNELRAFSKESRASRRRIVREALSLFLPHRLVCEPDSPLVVTPITAGRLTRTGGLIIEYADGEVVSVTSPEVIATFGPVARCEIADGGTGLRLFDPQGQVSWYPWTFFWPLFDPVVRAACDRAGFQRRHAIARHIRQHRKGRGWTSRQLAEKARLPLKAVKALESGGEEASQAELDALAAALGVEIPSLLP